MGSIKRIENTDLVFDGNTPNDKICEFIKSKLENGDELKLDFSKHTYYGDEFSVNEEWENQIFIVSYLNDEIQDSLTLDIKTLEIINL
jgi:hypothetical protein